ncbi:MAG: hypothetical protein GXN91_00695 [Epsilonproteobacteria bacterium]|nr:hypothetical protein [Campylobacterota bacterium]
MIKSLTLIISSLFILGFTPKTQAVGNLVEVEGKVAVFGNEPHTFVGIKTEDGVYKISNAKDFKLELFQNKVVKVKGVLLKKEVGPGMPAEIEVVDFAK